MTTFIVIRHMTKGQGNRNPLLLWEDQPARHSALGLALGDEFALKKVAAGFARKRDLPRRPVSPTHHLGSWLARIDLDAGPNVAPRSGAPRMRTRAHASAAVITTKAGKAILTVDYDGFRRCEL